MFTRTHDGLLVAKVRDNAFAMMPTRNDRYYLASAWRCRGRWKNGHAPISTVMAANSTDEAAFRARVYENAEHQRQRAALGRREIRTGANTPWGGSQCATVYADGVVSHSTAGHGGFHLDAAHNAKGPPCPSRAGRLVRRGLRMGGCRQALPELFTDYERRCADQTIRDWYPDAWEAPRAPASSRGISREGSPAFERDHASDWIVISAIRSDPIVA